MNNILIPKYTKKIFIVSQSADPAPPLGTVLGNLGVNTVQFCTVFNQYTKNLPNYFKLCTSISIYDNRSTSFFCSLPTTSYILSLLKYELTIKEQVNERFHDIIVSCIDINDLAKLAKLKMPLIPLEKSISVLLGTVKAHGYSVKIKQNI
jgi:large subunit ribosomal protein L11